MQRLDQRAVPETKIKNSTNYYVVLDSWRGICACFVALFHFASNSHTYDLPLFRHAYLFVDFFFVLSGFVVFANYEKRLQEGFGFWRFMLLRFGRLYPLHFAVLMAYIGVDIAQIIIPELSKAAKFAPFSAPGETWALFISNILLTHSLGIHDIRVWNGASWSISTEFYAYALFAGAILLFRNRKRWFLIFCLSTAPLFLAFIAPAYMDTTHQFGFIRCIYGFSAGAITWHLKKKHHDSFVRFLNKDSIFHTIEICTLIICFGFVTLAGVSAWSLFAPWIFALTVFVFSFERGIISRLLQKRSFVHLGMLSYSIYMNHQFISAKLFSAIGGVLDKMTPFTLMTVVNGRTRIGSELWQGDIFNLIYLTIVIACSYISYKLIEEPGRRWFRKIAYRRETP